MAKKKIIVNGETIVVQEDQILRFQNEIEALVDKSDMTYLEAITEYCQENDFEMETIGNLISIPLMEKIRQEASSLHLIKKSDDSSLPL